MYNKNSLQDTIERTMQGFTAPPLAPTACGIVASAEQLHHCIGVAESALASLNEKLSAVTADFPRPENGCKADDHNKKTCSTVRGVIDTAIERISRLSAAIADLTARIDL